MSEVTADRRSALAGEAGRFVAAGVANTAVSLLAYWLLLLVAPYGLAFALGYAAGVLTAYVLNTVFVFKVAWSFRRLLAFLPAQALNFFAGIAALWLVIEVLGVPDGLAPLITIPAVLPLNFLLSRFVIAGNQPAHRRNP